RRAALASAFGINAGIALWTIAAAVGLAALVRASAEAFAVVKLAGAAYLIYLGFQALRHAGRRHDLVAIPALTTRAAFRQGLVSNALNPKIAVFFTSLLPQFGSSLPQLLALGAIFNLLGIVWLSAYALAAARAGDSLRRPRVRSALDYLSGVVL